MERSVTDIPTRAGVSLLPVTEHKPTSPCTRKSYAFFCAPAPVSPYPEIVQVISFGFSIRSVCPDNPISATRPGAKLDTNTSALRNMAFITERSSAFFKFRVIDSFPRFSQAKIALSPLTPSSYCRAKSPSGRSTLITLAPASANKRPQYGAATACSREITKRPSSSFCST